MANLFASVGPSDVPGVLVSGHTDVVPVAGQAWTLPPFEGTLKGGRIYGRGACNMKAFVDGGKALNIVPNLCMLDFEIHHLPADDPASLVAALQGAADSLVREARQTSAKAAIEIETTHAYPGLATHPSVEAVRLLQRIVEPGTTQRKMAFGTQGGLSASRLDTPMVVCGPGGIEQAHKPDEYVELSQLAACDALLRRSRVALG